MTYERMHGQENDMQYIDSSANTSRVCWEQELYKDYYYSVPYLTDTCAKKQSI